MTQFGGGWGVEGRNVAGQTQKMLPQGTPQAIETATLNLQPRFSRPNTGDLEAIVSSLRSATAAIQSAGNLSQTLRNRKNALAGLQTLEGRQDAAGISAAFDSDQINQLNPDGSPVTDEAGDTREGRLLAIMNKAAESGPQAVSEEAYNQAMMLAAAQASEEFSDEELAAYNKAFVPKIAESISDWFGRRQEDQREIQSYGLMNQMIDGDTDAMRSLKFRKGGKLTGWMKDTRQDPVWAGVDDDRLVKIVTQAAETAISRSTVSGGDQALLDRAEMLISLTEGHLSPVDKVDLQGKLQEARDTMAVDQIGQALYTVSARSSSLTPDEREAAMLHAAKWAGQLRNNDTEVARTVTKSLKAWNQSEARNGGLDYDRRSEMIDEMLDAKNEDGSFVIPPGQVRASLEGFYMDMPDYEAERASTRDDMREAAATESRSLAVQLMKDGSVTVPGATEDAPGVVVNDLDALEKQMRTKHGDAQGAVIEEIAKVQNAAHMQDLRGNRISRTFKLKNKLWYGREVMGDIENPATIQMSPAFFNGMRLDIDNALIAGEITKDQHTMLVAESRRAEEASEFSRSERLQLLEAQARQAYWNAAGAKIIGGDEYGRDMNVVVEAGVTKPEAYRHIPKVIRALREEHAKWMQDNWTLRQQNETEWNSRYNAFMEGVERDYLSTSAQEGQKYKEESK